jgi:ankyrin repeat protein
MSRNDDVIVDRDKLFEAFRASVISFMSLLVQNKCGCLDVTNVEGNTALHILASYAVNNRVYGTTWSEDGVRDMAVECIQLLLASGAHRDVRNKARVTPADILARSDNAAVSSMMANYCPSLQCLAASVILELNLPLDDLSSDLKSFVLLH